MDLDPYTSFLAGKRIADPMTGMQNVPAMPAFMKDHQRGITSWALRRGRSAVFAGTGLGKTCVELKWGQSVADETKRPVLIFAPLAVSQQHIREAKKFDMKARLVERQIDIGPGVNVTNYQKGAHFDLSAFGGVAIDESSILKSTDGHYRNWLIEKCAGIPFRLAASATPAPNDFMELGSHAEFLGVMSYTDMLATFFVHDGGDTQKWRMKGHAEDEFWKWMASWAVMLRKPSDIGYSDEGYDLPPLFQHHHIARTEFVPSIGAGSLFPTVARSLSERIAARRDTVAERVAMAVDVTPDDRPFMWWCNLNSEAAALAKALPGAVNLSGADSDAEKEAKIADFIAGKTRTMISKPSICGFGLNFQHCADTGFVGLNDSWEQIYQAVRRFWRFGQTKPVNVHFIAAETEGAVVANLRRKEADAERMAAAMVRHMADLSSVAVRGMVRDRPDYNPTVPVEIPDFLMRAA